MTEFIKRKKSQKFCKGGLTADQGLLDFKQWSLPRKTPEGIKQGSPPSLGVPAPLRG
jgi:hypothetical protein